MSRNTIGCPVVRRRESSSSDLLVTFVLKVSSLRIYGLFRNPLSPHIFLTTRSTVTIRKGYLFIYVCRRIF